MKTSKRPKRLHRTTVYESEWINLHTDKVELPDGRVIEKMHVLDYPHEAVGVLVLNHDGDVLLEYAYRYHTDVDGWEIPAGKIESGETITEAGQREVLEETGYQTQGHALLYTYNPSNGSSNQVFHIVRCTVTDAEQITFDKNEVKEVKWFTPDEIKAMIQNNDISDGYTLSALLLHFFTRDLSQ